MSSWAPFSLDPPQRVDNRLHREAGMLRFEPVALGIVNGAAAWFEATDARDGFDLRLLLRVGAEAPDAEAQILAIESDLRNQRLVVAQDGLDLVLLSLRTVGGEAEAATMRAEDALTPGSWQTVRVYQSWRTTLMIDGEPGAVGRFPPLAGQLAPGEQLVLGAASSGQRGWNGELSDATMVLSGQEHDLLATEHLDIPDRLWMLPERLDETGMRRGSDHLSTSMLHIVLAWSLVTFTSLAVGLRQVPLGSGASWAIVVLIFNGGKIMVEARHPSAATALLQLGSGWLGLATSAAIVRRSRWPAG